jgi:hypothetical protein
MKVVIGLIAMTTWLLVSGNVHSATNAKSFAHLYTVAIDVDAKGDVVRTEPTADTPASVVAVLEQALKQWHFAPIMKDGQKASVHSYLVADVQALPAGTGKFIIQVSYVGVGPEYQKPKTGKGPDYPLQILQALVDGGRRHDTRVVVDLALPADGKLAATDAHVLTDAQLTMREKLTLIAAIKHYFLQGSVLPELVDGQAVAASMQQSVTISLFPEGPAIEMPVFSSGNGVHGADFRPNPQQAAAAQAMGPSAAYQDALQSHSVLKPSMVDTVTFQP